MPIRICFLMLMGSLISVPICAETLNVAVASNFTHTLKRLSVDFSQRTGHQLRISSASTGKLYTQIQHGAPFDVFLAADEKHPELLVQQNKADPDSAIVYATGRLMLMSNIDPTGFANGDCQAVLTSARLKRLSIANPRTAPYGLAAKQVLQKLELWQRVQPLLVRGENIAQTLQFVSTMNAEAGFVAKSMLNINKSIVPACTWDIPASLYSPINQKMVLLGKAHYKSSARAFLEYIQSASARTIIASSGYVVM